MSFDPNLLPPGTEVSTTPPHPQPFAGDDDPTDIEPSFVRDLRSRPPGTIDVDPPAAQTWHQRLAALDRIEAYLARLTERQMTPELRHVINLIGMGS